MDVTKNKALSSLFPELLGVMNLSFVRASFVRRWMPLAQRLHPASHNLNVRLIRPVCDCRDQQVTFTRHP